MVLVSKADCGLPYAEPEVESRHDAQKRSLLGIVLCVCCCIRSLVYLSGDKLLLFQRMNCLWLSLCVCGFLIGCGGGTEGVVPAKGTVTYKGAPIGKIAVVFMPKDGMGQIAEGKTDASGNFVLQTLSPGDGAKVGKYDVAFRYVSDVIPDMPGFPGGVKPEPSPIPEKYGDASKSGHTATVDADSSKNVFKFDLN